MLMAFDKLASELARRHVSADLFVVGGAAIALAYSGERRTRDVDAGFTNTAEVYEAARSVARRMKLPRDWLNDAVKSYLLGDDAESQVVYENGPLQVAVASPQYILAMKLLSARPEQDREDIRLLYDLCGYNSREDGLELLRRYLPDQLIPERSVYILEELFGERHDALS
jgi:hypothetical protein